MYTHRELPIKSQCAHTHTLCGRYKAIPSNKSNAVVCVWMFVFLQSTRRYTLLASVRISLGFMLSIWGGNRKAEDYFGPQSCPFLRWHCRKEARLTPKTEYDGISGGHQTNQIFIYIYINEYFIGGIANLSVGLLFWLSVYGFQRGYIYLYVWFSRIVLVSIISNHSACAAFHIPG